MEKTEAVKAAVEQDRIVVACAYHGWVPDEVKQALPPGFHAHSYVAKFEGGKLVALERGVPEKAISKLLGAEADQPENKGTEGGDGAEIARR
jgi:hypothetical protein